MKKRKTHLVVGSKIALVATMMAYPLTAAPDATPTPKPKADTSAPAASQKTAFKDHGKTTTLGKDAKGHVILQNSKGETFYLEPEGQQNPALSPLRTLERLLERPLR